MCRDRSDAPDPARVVELRTPDVLIGSAFLRNEGLRARDGGLYFVGPVPNEVGVGVCFGIDGAGGEIVTEGGDVCRYRARSDCE